MELVRFIFRSSSLFLLFIFLLFYLSIPATSHRNETDGRTMIRIMTKRGKKYEKKGKKEQDDNCKPKKNGGGGGGRVSSFDLIIFFVIFFFIFVLHIHTYGP